MGILPMMVNQFNMYHHQSIAFLFRFRSAYAEMATGTHLQNRLKKELQISFEEEEKEEKENGW